MTKGPAEFLRTKLVNTVRAALNDTANGQAPVVLSDNALFARDTPIRLVHADIVGMMVGGMAALLLQMLHPHALQGVLDHSNFRADMQGRLRRTARFIAVTSFADRAEAQAAIARVNAIHQHVHGTLPDGTPYSARDPRVLAWVHLTEAVCFLDAYLAYVRPAMPLAEQDEYFRQFAVIARALGCDPVPETKAAAHKLLREMRGDLAASAAAREVARLITQPQASGAAGMVQPVLARAAVALVPPYARRMLHLESGGLSALPNRLITRSLGSTLRWAFRQPDAARADQAKAGARRSS